MSWEIMFPATPCYTAKIVYNNHSMDAVYMDFQKAFDSLPHERLLIKLKGYGVQDNVLKWIAHFLYGREQWICLH